MLKRTKVNSESASPQQKAGTSLRGLEICVIGDLYQERYQFPTSVEIDAPFTFPDAMRGKTAVRIYPVESGAALHFEILRSLIQQQLNEAIGSQEDVAKTQFRFENDGVQVTLTQLAYDKAPWQYFPSYLHELGAYPSRVSSRGQSTKVWRIKETLGVILYGSGNALNLADSENATSIANKELAAYTNRQIRTAASAITKAKEVGKSLILVVNDRDQGFRRSSKESMDILLESCSSLGADHLIIWHMKNPFDTTNKFYNAIISSQSRHNTMVVINQQCLRDEGVNIRFDVSFEHTFRDLLAFSQHHPVLKRLLQFPQILIRYDYGVLHITNDLLGSDQDSDDSANNNVSRIISVDAHSMIGGPFYLSAQQHGMMTGRTFLLVAALVGEIARWFRGKPSRRLVDLLWMEGVQNHIDSQMIVKGKDKKAQRRSLEIPSILHSTLIDKSIDMGILLSATHFYHGYGEVISGKSPFESVKGSIPAHFHELFESFRLRIKRFREVDLARPIGETFAFRHEEPDLTRLTRFSLESDLISFDHQVAVRREQFSRVSMLGYKELTELAVIAAEDYVPPLSAIKFSQDSFESTLRNIVKYGIGPVLRRASASPEYFNEPSVILPYVQFGENLVTADRDEIDGFLGIRYLVAGYLANAKSSSRPLSIAVFGPPGSGKNFTVNQILMSVRKTVSSEMVNMSQLSSTRELARAFHRVQDRALAKEVPVAFFDEFDSSLDGVALGWLKYFLSPMQDGLFFDGDDTFHVGPAIYVFGGGTAPTFARFVELYGNDKQIKAPDFISRLRGHIDIQDISKEDSAVVDMRLQVKRALLLRSLLIQRAPTIFDETGEVARIEDAVLDAFLHVASFKHGVRSMEAIIDMSRVSDSGSYQKSSLPTIAQLDMHVDARAFTDLVNLGREEQKVVSRVKRN
jgi:hypothetical protein